MKAKQIDEAVDYQNFLHSKQDEIKKEKGEICFLK